MIRGLHTAATGMFSMERKQEALAHNLANAQTPGYKKDDPVLRAFPNMLIQRINDFRQTGNIPGVQAMPDQRIIGELTTGVYAQERIPSFLQGPLVETGGEFDFALDDQGLPAQNVDGQEVQPKAFFAVELPDGTVGYTRNGKWDMDSNGNIVTAEGYHVLAENDQLAVAIIENPNELRRIGGSVYLADDPVELTPAGDTPGVNVHQGFIEQSNVDPGQTITEMMVAMRSYEANQKVINAYDQSLQQLYSIGKING